MKEGEVNKGERGMVEGPWLIAGLGNPGAKYEGTRHNVGFEMVERVAREEGISISAMQCKALIGKGRICGVPVLLAKPQTYMNLSGESICPLAAFYKIPPSRVLVMYDELEFDVAVMKLLQKGGHGGHNGMKSLIQGFRGSKDFPRIRFGIGRPSGGIDMKAYVLQKFNKSEREEVDMALDRISSAIRLITSEGLDKAVSTWNSPRRQSSLK